MMFKAAIALVLPLAAVSACKAQAPQPSQSHAVTVILHDFYEPKLVTLSVGPRVVFRDMVKSEGTSAIASSIRVDLRNGDRVCASFGGQDHCRVVAASDSSKEFLLVSAPTRLTPFRMEFVDQPMLD